MADPVHNTTQFDRTERVARAVCAVKCFRQEVFGKPCLSPPDGRNGPCEATQGQLLLSWRWHAAQLALEAADAES